MAKLNVSNTAVVANLTALLTDVATAFSVTDATGYPASDFKVWVDNEVILVNTRTGTNFTSVTRGHDGTVAAQHEVGAAVRHVTSAEDFQTRLLGFPVPVPTVGEDGFTLQYDHSNTEFDWVDPTYGGAAGPYIPTTDYNDFVNVTGDSMTGPLTISPSSTEILKLVGPAGATSGYQSFYHDTTRVGIIGRTDPGTEAIYLYADEAPLFLGSYDASGGAIHYYVTDDTDTTRLRFSVRGDTGDIDLRDQSGNLALQWDESSSYWRFYSNVNLNGNNINDVTTIAGPATTDMNVVADGSLTMSASPSSGDGTLTFQTALAGVDKARFKILGSGDITTYEANGTTVITNWDESENYLHTFAKTYQIGEDVYRYNSPAYTNGAWLYRRGPGWSSSGNGIQGTIGIKFPNIGQMFSARVMLYNYSGTSYTELFLGGYTYVSGQYWVNTTAHAVGNIAGSNIDLKTVRFVNDDTTNEWYVLLGTSASVWAYPKVYFEIMQGHSSDIAQDYELVFFEDGVTDEPTWTSSTTRNLNEGSWTYDLEVGAGGLDMANNTISGVDRIENHQGTGEMYLYSSPVDTSGDFRIYVSDSAGTDKRRFWMPGSTGDIFFRKLDGTTDVTWWDESTGWWEFAANVDLNDNWLQGVKDPTADAHVGDRAYNDARYALASGGPYLPLAGGTMTGDVNFDGSDIDNLLSITAAATGFTLNDDIGTRRLQLETDGDIRWYKANGTAEFLSWVEANDALYLKSNVIGQSVFTKLEGTADATLADDTGILQIGTSGGPNLGIDGNEIVARTGSGTAATLAIQPGGGQTYFYGAVSMQDHTLSGPLDPTAGTHVGDRDYNDARYVNVVGGDTMDPLLTIGDSPGSTFTGLSVSAAHESPTGNGMSGQVYIYSTDTVAADVGGQISFGGLYSGLSETRWAAIGGFKENATSGQYGGWLGFYARLHGQTGPSLRQKLHADGDISFFKVDGSTSSLLWDESDNQWEFSTDVSMGDNDIVGVTTLQGPSTVSHLLINDDAGTTRIRLRSTDSVNFYGTDSTLIALFQNNTAVFTAGVRAEAGIDMQGSSITEALAVSSLNTDLTLSATNSGAAAQNVVINADDATGTLRTRIAIDGDGTVAIRDNAGVEHFNVNASGAVVSDGHYYLTETADQYLLKQGSGDLYISNYNDGAAIRIQADNSVGAHNTRILIDGDSHTYFYDDDAKVRFRIDGSATQDLIFFKGDGATGSLLWDESDDRWEFSTNVHLAGGSITGVNTFESTNTHVYLRGRGSSGAWNVYLQTDDSSSALKTRQLIEGGSGDISFFKADGATASLLWDESDDRWEFATSVDFGGYWLNSVNEIRSNNTDIQIQAINSGAAAQNIGLYADDATGTQRLRILVDGDGNTTLYDNAAAERLRVHTDGVRISVTDSGLSALTMYGADNQLRIRFFHDSAVESGWVGHFSAGSDSFGVKATASDLYLIANNDLGSTAQNIYLQASDSGGTNRTRILVDGDDNVNVYDTTGAIVFGADATGLNLYDNPLYGPADPTLGTHIGDRDYNDGRYLHISGSQESTGTQIFGNSTASIEVQAGNSSADFTKDQIRFGYQGTSQYRHAIKTRHMASAGAAGNAFDFFTWQESADALGDVGTFKALTLDKYGSELFTNLDINSNAVTNLGSITTPTAQDNLQVNTEHGYIQIGPQNETGTHIYTDLPTFYMNKPLYFVNNGGPLLTFDGDDTTSYIQWINDSTNLSMRVGHTSTGVDDGYVNTFRGNLYLNAENSETDTGAVIYLRTDDSTGTSQTRQAIYGTNGDIVFYENDGSTVSLRWDDSEDRWEFTDTPYDISRTSLLAAETWVQSRGTNLVTNGFGLLNDNTNFSGTTFDNTESYGGGGSFKKVSGSTTLLADEFMPIDGNRMYRFTYAIKGDSFGDTPPQRHYGMTTCYDADKLSISPQMVQWYDNTETTLAADLNDDDTTITLTDASNWTDAYSGDDHRQSIILFPYTNSFGYTYPDYTYSRHIKLYAWTLGGITGNVITLQTPWAGGSFAAGTKVANNYSGGTYSYIAGSNAYTPEDWAVWTGTQGGWNTPGSTGNSADGFRQGTAYVKVGWLLNRDAPANSTSWLDGISWVEEHWLSGGDTQSNPWSLRIATPGNGDDWTSQGGQFVVGEGANVDDQVVGATRMSYVGNGQGYVGMGIMDGTGNTGAGQPDQASISFIYNYGSMGFYDTDKYWLMHNGSSKDTTFYDPNDGTTPTLAWDDSDNWWEFWTDVQAKGNIIMETSADTIQGSSSNSLNLYGGPGATGARIELWSSDDDTYPNNAYFDSDLFTWRDADASPTFMTLSGSALTVETVLNVNGAVGLGADGGSDKTYVGRFGTAGNAYGYFVAGRTDENIPVGFKFQPRDSAGAIASDALIIEDTGITAGRDLDMSDSDILNVGYLSTLSTTDYDADTGGWSFRYATSGATNKPTGTDHAVMTMAYSVDWSVQLAADWRTNKWYVREQNNTTWGAWDQILTDADTITDDAAIHDNVGSEISAITAKATPTSADFLLIEDAAASNAKKRITIGDLPASGGSSTLSGLDDTVITSVADGEVLVWSTADWVNQTLTEAGILGLAGGTMTGNIVWSNATFPQLLLDSRSDGADWTSQGALIAAGEGATDSSSTAIKLTYTGAGDGYVGMGRTDGAGITKAGRPELGSIEFSWNSENVSLHRGNSTAQKWDAAGDIIFYKDDGSTVSLLWDESGDRWELGTDLVGSTSSQIHARDFFFTLPAGAIKDENGQNRIIVRSSDDGTGGDLEFSDGLGVQTLLWDNSDDRWEFLRDIVMNQNNITDAFIVNSKWLSGYTSPFNSFGAERVQNALITNQLWLADVRGTVTITGDSPYSGGASLMFNGDWDSSARWNDGDSTVITIDMEPVWGVTGITYPGGSFIVAMYYTNEATTITMRYKDKDDTWYAQGAPDRNIANIGNRFIYEWDIPGSPNYVTHFEVSISSSVSDAEPWVTQIEYYPDRPSGYADPVAFQKYKEQTLYKDLNIDGSSSIDFLGNSTDAQVVRWRWDGTTEYGYIGYDQNGNLVMDNLASGKNVYIRNLDNGGLVNLGAKDSGGTTRNRIVIDGDSSTLFYDNTGTLQWTFGVNENQSSNSINMLGNDVIAVPLVQALNTDLTLWAANSGAAAQNVAIKADDASGTERTRVLIDGDGNTNFYDNTGTQVFTYGVGYAEVDGSMYVDNGGEALLLKPASEDHVYMGWYPDTASPTTRHAYMGYSYAGSTELTIFSERGDISIVADNAAAAASNIKLQTADSGGTLRDRIFIDGDGDTVFYDDAGVAKLTWDDSENEWKFGSDLNMGVSYQITGVADLVFASDIDLQDINRSRLQISPTSGTGDILFLSDTGSTVLLWDKSDDQWEFYSGIYTTKDIRVEDTTALLYLERPSNTGNASLIFETNSVLKGQIGLNSSGSDNFNIIAYDGDLYLNAQKSTAAAANIYMRADDSSGTQRNRIFIDGDGDTVFYNKGGTAKLTIEASYVALYTALNMNGYNLTGASVIQSVDSYLYLDATSSGASAQNIYMRADYTDGTPKNRFVIQGANDIYFYKTDGTTSAMRWAQSQNAWVMGTSVDLDMSGGTVHDNRPAGTTSSATTLDGADNIMLCTTSSASYNVTVPLAASYTGKAYFIQRKGATHAVKVVRTSTNTFWQDGTSTYTTISLDSEGASVGIYSDGTNWIVSGTNGTVSIT